MWLPKVFTSGGQSAGYSRAVDVVVAAVEAVAADEENDDAEVLEPCFLLRAIQSATDVQERHLCYLRGHFNHIVEFFETHGLPSLPNTTPFGNFFGGAPPPTFPPSSF